MVVREHGDAGGCEALGKARQPHPPSGSEAMRHDEPRVRSRT